MERPQLQNSRGEAVALDSRPCLLLVDDDRLNLTMLEGMLSAVYNTAVAHDGDEALEILRQHGNQFQAVLLDRLMPGLSGDDVLQQLRGIADLAQLPVVFQTSRASGADIRQGLALGADYYVTKPYDRDRMLGTVASAVERYATWTKAQQKLHQTSEVLRTLQTVQGGALRFRFRDFSTARNLATLLANACPSPSRTVVGLIELSYNAVEHGIAKISYAEKTALIDAGGLDAERERRIAATPGQYAWIHMEIMGTREPTAIEFRIDDPGEGFDYQRYLDPDPERAFDSHGRGIAMSRALSFSELSYIGKGNSVRARVDLQ